LLGRGGGVTWPDVRGGAGLVVAGFGLDVRGGAERGAAVCAVVAWGELDRAEGFGLGRAAGPATVGGAVAASLVVGDDAGGDDSLGGPTTVAGDVAHAATAVPISSTPAKATKVRRSMPRVI
jgi:hypothetical protein